MTNKWSLKGFTLIELMMTVLVTTVLIAAATPSLRDVLQRNAQQAVLADLNNTLAFARSQAMTRGQIISICQSNSTGTACSTTPVGDWSTGWIVFVDPTPPGGSSIAAVIDSGEQILQVHGAVKAGTTVLMREGLAANDTKTSIRINRSGFLNSVGPTQALFVVCRTGGDATKALGLFVNNASRVSLTRDSNGDGTQDFQGSSGTEALSCT